MSTTDNDSTMLSEKDARKAADKAAKKAAKEAAKETETEAEKAVRKAAKKAEKAEKEALKETKPAAPKEAQKETKPAAPKEVPKQVPKEAKTEVDVSDENTVAEEKKGASADKKPTPTELAMQAYQIHPELRSDDMNAFIALNDAMTHLQEIQSKISGVLIPARRACAKAILSKDKAASKPTKSRVGAGFTAPFKVSSRLYDILTSQDMVQRVATAGDNLKAARFDPEAKSEAIITPMQLAKLCMSFAEDVQVEGKKHRLTKVKNDDRVSEIFAPFIEVINQMPDGKKPAPTIIAEIDADNGLPHSKMVSLANFFLKWEASESK